MRILAIIARILSVFVFGALLVLSILVTFPLFVLTTACSLCVTATRVLLAIFVHKSKKIRHDSRAKKHDRDYAHAPKNGK